MKLKGKNVLVTGGARRVGRAIVTAFAARGANVAIHARRSIKEAQALAVQIRERGVRAWVVKADLSRPAEVRGLLAGLRRRKVRIDILVNNASPFGKTPFRSVSWRDWDRFFDVHVKAPLALAQGLFKGKAAGRIVNILDAGLKRPDPDYLPYQVSKSALSFLTRGLAKALAPTILVTAVSPGLVLPPERLGPKDRRRVAKEMGEGKWGRPEDVARAVIESAESKKTGIERDVLKRP